MRCTLQKPPKKRATNKKHCLWKKEICTKQFGSKMLVEVLQIVFDLMSNCFVQDKIAKEDMLAMIIHLSNIIRVNKNCASMRT